MFNNRKRRMNWPRIVASVKIIRSDFIRSRKSPDTSYVIPSITSAQVLTMLQKLAPHKAAGIDKISSQLLRIAAPVIAPVVARLINFSFSSGSFPSRWKTAKVSPLYKNGDLRDVQNFRPISCATCSFKNYRETCA